ncbi:SBBP repeat-containing protein [Thermodesulfobacteriota bacterium]
MKRSKMLLALILFLTLASTSTVYAKVPSMDTSSVQTSKTAKNPMFENFGKIPLGFEKNLGQCDNEVKFLSRGSGYTIFLTDNGMVLTLKKSGKTENDLKSVVHMKLLGANPNPYMNGVEQLPRQSNYFIGKNSKNWLTNIPNYTKIEYKNIYPGINQIYYGNQSQLEYDFVVSPGADPSLIQLAFEGHDKLEINDQGNLILYIEDNKILLHKPLIYQMVKSLKQTIPGRYVFTKKNQIGFQLTKYDSSRPLIIDPVLSFSTYLGGSNRDWGSNIAVDTSGNVYVASLTKSIDFPTTDGAYMSDSPGSNSDPLDGYIVKLNASGEQLIWSTYLGGTGQDRIYDMAIDSSGQVYVTGNTDSNDFPITNDCFQSSRNGGLDVFITKIKANGSELDYSTFIGGNGTDSGSGIVIDSSENAYISGWTQSPDFPITGGAYQPIYKGGYSDAFVVKLNPNGTQLVYSTFLGGTSNDQGFDIAVDNSGNALVVGRVGSSDYPTTTDCYQPNNKGMDDGFVTKLNTNGSDLIYSTFLGGNSEEEAERIVIDSSGNAYVTGGTRSNDFPTTEGAYQTTINGHFDRFITKLNPNGTALVFSTYLGGSGAEQDSSIAIDTFENVYITGDSQSVDCPLVNPIQDSSGGGNDIFLVKLNFEGSEILFSTYLGGSGHDDGGDIFVDIYGNIYVVGNTQSDDFPTTIGAFQPSFQGGLMDAFVAKIVFNHPPEAIVEYIVEQVGYNGALVILDGSESTDYDSTPGTNNDIVLFQWYKDDNLLGSGEIISYTFPLGGHNVVVSETGNSSGGVVSCTIIYASS